MKPLVVVPAFNEEVSIGEVLTDLKKHGYTNIVVVDDGSSDACGKIAREEGAFVLRHILNRGLGAALGTGFEFARSMRFDTLVTFDADGQHRAADIAKLLVPIRENRADVVIGSRLLGETDGMPGQRKILNRLSNILTYLLFGVATTDSQSGLRAFNQKAVGCLVLKTDRMEVSSEFFKEIRRNKLRFAEVPIKPIYTDYSLKGSSQEENASAKIAFRLVLRLFR